MNWHCIRLSRQEYQSGEVAILQGAFREAYVASNGPRGMALFGRWSEDQQFYLVYATPVSERYLRPILQAYSARQTDPPGPGQDLTFISGDEEGLSALIC